MIKHIDIPQTNNFPIVSIAKCANYDIDQVETALKEALNPLGGIEKYVNPGDKVLLKVNLLRASEPDKAVTTHPALIEALIKMIKNIGATPIVGDSPGGPNTPKMLKNIIEKTEIGELCKRTQTELIMFDEDVTTIDAPQSKLFPKFRIGRIIKDADVIIALPKLKTHGFMKLTGAVKIMFVAIPGLEKAQFHLKVPNRMDFANMLIDLYLATKPKLAIMDAIVAMEGEGPSGGDPKQIGALLASTDCVALDVIASKIIGLDPMDVYSNRAAIDRGLINDINKIVVQSVPIEEIKVSQFKLASKDLSDRASAGILFRFLKDITTSKPYLQKKELCNGCGICKDSCPAKAITYKNKKPQFDYKTCIRCYCCEELCTQLAIRRKNHWLIRPFVKDN